MKFVFNFTYYLFIVVIVLIASLLLTTLIPVPGNFKVKIVKSGSMEPYIKTGGIVVIKPFENYVINDVVTFGEDTSTQIPTTHRIINVVGDGTSKQFVTKGDANDTEDPELVSLSEVRGKVVLTVPYLGYVLDFAKQPIGFGILVGVPALVIIIEEIGKIISEIRRIRKNKENDVAS